MTAEIAILNKQCVALAADSAVTTGEAKIFNTVNKLFGLSKRHPVGIMAFSSAEVMGVPIETVIKEFRRLQDDNDVSYDHLEEYANAFRDFLFTDATVLFDENVRLRSMQHIIFRFFFDIRRRSENRARRKYFNAGWGHPTKEEARTALIEALDDIEHNWVMASPPIAVSDRAQVERTIAGAVGSVITDGLKELKSRFPVSREVARRIRSLAIEQYFHQWSCGGDTGFAIAGFGRNDIFPRLRSFEFTCSAFELHKVDDYPPIDISRDQIAAIMPFAQRDVVDTFIYGKDNLYDSAITNVIDSFFAEKVRLIDSNTPSGRRRATLLRDVGTELKNVMRRELQAVAQESFSRPLIEVVASMPKEDVAFLAEALIDLTSLRRKASKDAETVGGPTDVAVISKGDGFIWIKRKHYFESKFNPQFAWAYLQGGKS